MSCPHQRHIVRQEAEHGREQHGGERDIVNGVVDDLQQRYHKRYLGRGQESDARFAAHGYPPAVQLGDEFARAVFGACE